MSALQSHGRFHLRMVNDDQLQVIKLAAGKYRGKLFDNREGKNFINHYAILYLQTKKRATEVALTDYCFISTYLEM